MQTSQTSNTYIYGTRALQEAFKANKAIDKIYLQKSNLQSPVLKEVLSLAKSNGVSLHYVPVEKLNRLSKHQNHQGIIGIISPVRLSSLEEIVEKSLDLQEKEAKMPLFIMLDQLTDVRNFGAILRTAACVGASGVILPKKGAVAINADAVKTSAGAIFKVPICKVDHLKDAVYYLQGSGIEVLAASEKAENTIYDTDFKKPLAIVMGSEGKGISKSLLTICSHVVKLPMPSGVASLNVSVACGVILYESIRQQL